MTIEPSLKNNSEAAIVSSFNEWLSGSEAGALKLRSDCHPSRVT